MAGRGWTVHLARAHPGEHDLDTMANVQILEAGLRVFELEPGEYEFSNIS